MKVQGTGDTWANRPEEKAGQMTHNENVEAVLLADGWHWIEPGSFKLMKTSGNPQKPGVPFVRFNMLMPEADIQGDVPMMTVEVFPNQMHGVGYRTPPEGDDDGDAALMPSA